MAIKDGEVKVIGKALGNKKGGAMINKVILEKGGIDFSKPYGVVWSGLDKTNLERYIQENAELWKDVSEYKPYILGCTVGTHIGPGAFGVAFFEK